MTVFRLLAATYLSRILLALVGAVALLAVADMAETSRQLADHDEPLRLLLVIYGNLLPSLALQALPVAVLLGLLLAVTDLSRGRELLALHAAGAGSLRIALPALIIAVVLTGSGILIADRLAPPGVATATRVQMEELGRMRSSWSPFHGEHHWFRADGGGLYYVGEASENGKRLRKLRRYDHRDGRVTSLADVDELVWDGAGWQIEGEARVWRLEPEDGSRLRLHGNLPRVEGPKRFARIRAHPEALSSSELEQAIELQRVQGRPTLPFELEAYGRWTMPLLCLALSLMALGLGLRRPPSTPVEASATAIAIAFGTWTLLAVCRAMGHAGMLSPAPSAFVPVLVPALAGLALLIVRR
ncbi:MAG: LptF/LptG family permease [Myxococcota bacterium]